MPLHAACYQASYEVAVMNSIRAGGCTASRATLAGALFAAAGGRDVIPRKWIKLAPCGAEVEKLAALLARGDDDVELPEQDFTYVAGNADRPFQQFTGRWQAIKPILSEMLATCGSDRPLRILDLGSCSGFFALKAAYSHPEADVVAVEGSVGVGNGTVGVQGTTRQILQTDAVQNHLRWIQQLALANCFVAPEVWDYARVCKLAASGRTICDAMFMLSVVHHIDNVSVQQYTSAGLSRLDGGIDLLAKLLMLAPRHFVELPCRPWMTALYDAHGSARGILEAATKATGRQWTFRGPIYSAEWFGERDTWVIEAMDPLPDLDIQSCPFPLLYRGDEAELATIPPARSPARPGASGIRAERSRGNRFSAFEAYDFPGLGSNLSLDVEPQLDFAGGLSMNLMDGVKPFDG
ncbi:unnamed protein product, partial [Polarella glacialis]